MYGMCVAFLNVRVELCVCSHPSPRSEVFLNSLQHVNRSFGCVVGFLLQNVVLSVRAVAQGKIS